MGTDSMVIHSALFFKIDFCASVLSTYKKKSRYF